MCTTFVADTIARRLDATVERVLLVRCNPAVEYKTRGNAALAIHTAAPAEAAFEAATEAVDSAAETVDERTNPGVVVADCDPEAVPEPVVGFARDAVRDHLTRKRATAIGESAGFRIRSWKNGRGVIGALAAIGAWRAFDEWTHEYIAYRERTRWGSDRDVDADSVFDVADDFYPDIWDTVDRGTGEVVCVPRTPGPVLYGIRGDDPDVCRAAAKRIDSEPIARARTFVTNQGTDSHLRDGSTAVARDDHAYRLDGTVSATPETRRGGHVFFRVTDADVELRCVAFEPTKRFRDRIRMLRIGDRITVCGEVSDGTLKLEKFALREPETVERVTPNCPDCGRSMESAGRDQGYRCRDCGTTAPEKVDRELDRELEPGWYEVPPRARRHVVKPLIRGDFDARIHPER